MSAVYTYACRPAERHTRPSVVRRSALLLAAVSLPLGVAMPAHAAPTARPHTAPAAVVVHPAAQSLSGTTRAARQVLTTPSIALLPLAPTRVSGTVNVAVANVRSGPGTGHRLTGQMRRGAKVTGTKTSNGWVKMSNGSYISGSLVSGSGSARSSSSSRTVTRYVTATSGNVRSGASTSHRVVTSLRKGTKVTGTVSSNGWIRIKSGQYISSVILSSRAPSSSSRSSSRSASTVTRYVTASSGNVRSGAGTSYQVVDSLRRNTKVTGTLTSSGWLKMSSGRYISTNILRGATSSSSGSRLSSSAVINEARKYAGIMYVYGGTTTAGFDCSGYTQYVFKKLGVVLPRVVSQQYAATTRVSSPKVGDLVFWGTYHVAIYAGNGYVYDSGRAGLPVQKRKMFSGVTSYGRVG